MSGIVRCVSPVHPEKAASPMAVTPLPIVTSRSPVQPANTANPRPVTPSGIVTLADYPRTFVYVYQALHGAACLHTGQADLAIALIETPLQRRWKEEYLPLWRDPQAIGWPAGLPEGCIQAWEFLQALP